MPFDPIFLLYGAVFLCALLLIEGVFYLYVDTRLSRRRINRRMDLLNSGKEGREALEILRPEFSQSGNAKGFGRIIQWFRQLISNSGLSIKPKKAFLMMSGVTAVIFLLGVTLGEMAVLPPDLAKPVFLAVVALVLGFGLPVIRLRYMARSRIKKFGDQLPDALDIIVRSLKAGHPINSALSLVAKEMPDPIGTEFGFVVDEMTYGYEMQEALEHLARRVPVHDFQYVVMAISIQSETGGNLAEVLSNLAHVIRERHRMFMKIRALSGEGRVSAMILCILPFIVAALVFASAPSFYLDVADDPIFMPTSVGILMLMLAGVYSIRRMVNFRV